ncbi:MAG: hypothetical protein ACHQUC_05565 [Chlamydiales bacterium]
MRPTCSPSSSSNPLLVIPLQIDFREKEEEARIILTNSEIKIYALNALIRIQELDRQITHEIVLYNRGNLRYRKAIDLNIDTILRNHIAKANFPRIFLISELKRLQAFFSPLKQQYKRLKEDLYEPEREIESAKKMLLEEKNRKLSLFLRDE